MAVGRRCSIQINPRSFHLYDTAQSRRLRRRDGSFRNRTSFARYSGPINLPCPLDKNVMPNCAAILLSNEILPAIWQYGSGTHARASYVDFTMEHRRGKCVMCIVNICVLSWGDIVTSILYINESEDNRLSCTVTIIYNLRPMSCLFCECDKCKKCWKMLAYFST